MAVTKALDLFIPSSRNNYRAKLVQLPALAVFIFLFLLFKTSLTLYGLNQPAVLGYASKITPPKIVRLTNLQRKEHGLAPLALNNTLSEAAQRKASDMFAFDYWSHNSPSGRTPWDFFKEVNYSYTYAGENLARDFYESGAVVGAWMNSPSHRENILEKNYEEIGVAVVNGTLQGVETTLVVQMFGTPSPAMASAPTPRDELTDASVRQEQIVQGQAAVTASSQAPTVNKTWVLKLAGLVLLGVLLVGFAIDRWLIARNDVPRLRGDNIAHIGFLLAIILAVLLIKPGVIL